MEIEESLFCFRKNDVVWVCREDEKPFMALVKAHAEADGRIRVLVEPDCTALVKPENLKHVKMDTQC